MTAHAAHGVGMPVAAGTARWRQHAAWRWLVLPWRAHDMGGQWFMTAIFLAALLLAALTIPLTRPAWQVPSAGMIGAAVGIAWFYFLPRSLRLVAAARELCLPHALREIQASLIVYAVLGCVVPAVVFGAAGGPGLAIGLWFVFGSAGIFLFTLLPMWIAVGLLFLPAIVTKLGALLALSVPELPQPGAPGFLTWLALVGVALVCLAVARWRWVTTHPRRAGRWTQSFGWALSAGNAVRAAGGPQVAESTLARRRHVWLQPQPDLRGVGAARPVKSLRVAIGGAFAPTTWRSQIRGLAWVFGMFALVFGFVLFVSDPHEGTPRLAHFIFRASGWFILFAGFVSAWSALVLLHRRWSRPNASLALMALLPGLAPGEAIKRKLLAACLRTPLVIWLTTAVIGCVLVGLSGRGYSAPIASLFGGIVLGGCILIVTVTLGILGGRRLTRAAIVVLSVYAFIVTLVTVGAMIAVFTQTGGALAAHLDSVVGPIVLWVILFAALGVMGWRGACAFARQPHPFLAGTR